MPLDTTLPTLFPELLSAADAAVLHQHAEAADAAGALHPEQQALIHARGWLRALAPREVGGEEWPLPRMVRLEEAIAAADGSCGWVVTLCAGAGWFAGFLPLALARSLMATPQLCLAGSGAVGGVAEREGAGWRLRGEWGFATGAPMATHFTLNARLQRDGLALSDASGQPRVQAFVLDAAQVRAGTGWRSLGMRSTGTHGFAVDGVWVPETQAFDIRPEAATAAGALYSSRSSSWPGSRWRPICRAWPRPFWRWPASVWARPGAKAWSACCGGRGRRWRRCVRPSMPSSTPPGPKCSRSAGCHPRGPRPCAAARPSWCTPHAARSTRSTLAAAWRPRTKTAR